MNLDDKRLLKPLLKKVKKGDRKAQHELYKGAFAYGMSVCLRYSANSEQAKDILNEAFLKIFMNIGKYDSKRSFRGWIRRIFINTAIDFYRKHKVHEQALDISHAEFVEVTGDVLDSMSVEEIHDLLHRLPPSYRTVFNLYVVEGYNHREIGEMLGISEGTSKSNLAKARTKLKKLMAGRNYDYTHERLRIR